MANEKKNENTDNKQKKTPVKAKVQSRRQSKAKTTENKDTQVDSKSPKRRSKAEIEAAKREKLERKLERERKKAALEAKRKERADKKAAREAKTQAKIEAAAAKEAQKSEDAKIQKIIDGLKIDTNKYCAATPMTAKEKALVKKCLTSPSLVMSRCYQAVGGTEFHLLNWGVNEFIISRTISLSATKIPTFRYLLLFIIETILLICSCFELQLMITGNAFSLLK